MNELNKELRSQAVALGLCNDWQGMWKKDWSNEKMVQMMYKGLDFCLKYHYPSNEFILKHFDIDFRRKSNVYVDDKYSVLNANESLILGKSEMIFRYNAENHGSINIRDNSYVKLTAKGRSFVIVHLFENAYIEAQQQDSAKIVLIKHSQNVTIIAEKDVKVREEYDYLK